MNCFENYTLLFTDTLTSNLVFIFKSEMALSIMKVFGYYDVWLMVIIASFANICAGVINYIFGITTFKILKSPAHNSNDHINQLSQIRINKFKKSQFIPIFLLLASVPFWGKFVLLFAGFIRLNFVKTIIITSFAKIVYYAYFILIL